MTARFPQEVKIEAVEMFKTGNYTMEVVAQKYGASRECVRRWCHLDPQVIGLQEDALKMRSEGISCKEIAKYSSEQYFPIDYRIIGSWTRGLGSSYRTKYSEYHENKAIQGWKLLGAWKRPLGVSEHLKILSRSRLWKRLYTPRHIQNLRKCI